MDILHMNKEEIKQMSIREYTMAVEYTWGAYTQRRVDFWVAKAFGEEGNKTKKKDEKYSIDWTPLNKVSQRLEKEKQEKRMRRSIPPTFEKYLKEKEVEHAIPCRTNQ